MVSVIEMRKIIKVGAGASGVYLSILLKQSHPSLDVIVLEANKTPLKKLLATGNGRCNLSNKEMNISHYEGDQLDLVKDIVEDFNMEEAMKSLGLYTKYMGNLLYPRSEQAKSVKNILMSHAENLGVVFLYEQKVEDIYYDGTYHIKTETSHYHSDGVVLAMGTPAGKLSTMDDRQKILRHLDLSMKKMTPSLTQMITYPVYKQLKGVRVKGHFTLEKDGRILREEDGELLFTQYGVSGIAVMQLSRCYEEGCRLHIDMMKEYTKEELKDIIDSLQELEHPYDGLVPYQISALLEKTKPLPFLKDLTLEVKELREAQYAQVMSGGILLENVNSSLESKKYPHLYAMGELLNVTGDCGGYNLHFALACAKRIARDLKE
jgi:predicted Rossmann fold flavoprotein